MKRLFDVLLLLMIAGFGLYSVFPGFRFFVSSAVSDTLDRVGRNDYELPFSLTKDFNAHIFADTLPGVQKMTKDPKGTLIASLSSEGKIVALPDLNNDGMADNVITVLDDLAKPNGIVFVCSGSTALPCPLYVAETDRIVRYLYDSDTYIATGGEVVARLPRGGLRHFTRSLLLAPDREHLLIAVGASCDVCFEQETDRAVILSLDLTTHKLETFAEGLRYSVGMDINPTTGEIWTTDLGRDSTNASSPPDEINIIEKGKSYGWPVCFGDNVHDIEFDTKVYAWDPCQEPYETPPHIELPPHVSPFALAFVPTNGWPAYFEDDVFLAYHGSLEKGLPVGYEVVRVPLDADGDQNGAIEPFMGGFLASDNSILGRPAGLLAEEGGVLYVSDSHAGLIYKVVYVGR